LLDAVTGGVWWVTCQGRGSFSFDPPERLAQMTAEIMANASPGVPGAAFVVGFRGQTVAGMAAGPVLAEDRGVFDVRVIHANRAAFLEIQRRESRWFGGIVGAAALTTLGGFWVTRRALRRERQLSEMKSNFVSSVSHELRAPVASLRLMVEGLESDSVAADAVPEFHRLMASECSRLAALIDNVMDFSRMEDGRSVWRFAPCRLEAIVRETVQMMQPQAAAKGITLEVQTADCDGTITADAHSLMRALTNLLDNALKFSPAPGVITVCAECREGAWRLSVTDAGPGIPHGEQERIFERFHRLGNELRRETQGAGIGLSIVKHIASAHGGAVFVECDPGKATTVGLTGYLKAVAAVEGAVINPQPC
jgi:signal transduction histidine kinase